MDFIKELLFLVFVTVVSFLICATIALGVVYVTNKISWFVPITFFGTIILCSLFGAFGRKHARR